MNVRELIKKLEQLEPTAEVVLGTTGNATWKIDEVTQDLVTHITDGLAYRKGDITFQRKRAKLVVVLNRKWS